ncbi:MAG: bifunctional 2-polyprenyl-6-hydroxyphenol methylase/3-demethylubiquinol 3-O-methyltransferase UbiG [Candidatus Lightella neohaematopini]|nr:bifunctional 2-polyprenyl-6-hydroxyphenol methylase/3-demethylubiquinol 3-O-methyltransferase UbiG [Candidatus Lightella neohaematopini]
MINSYRNYNSTNIFNYNINDWWNINGNFRLLHKINPIRLRYIIMNVDDLNNKNVLDVGCGGGILSESMALEGANVTGIDINSKLINIARSHMSINKLKINYIQQTIKEHTNSYKNMYDIITCMEVLEHINQPIKLINQCAKLVKPGGKVFFSTINRNLKSWLLSIIIAENVLNFIPKGTHSFNKLIKPSELLSWIDKTTLYEKGIIGIKYNPLTNNFYLSKNINVNYIVYTIRQY